MKPEGYLERIVDIGEWQVRLTSYQLGNVFYCKSDNVSPGAWLVRTSAPTREEAEQKALERATQILHRTRKYTV